MVESFYDIVFYMYACFFMDVHVQFTFHEFTMSIL